MPLGPKRMSREEQLMEKAHEYHKGSKNDSSYLGAKAADMYAHSYKKQAKNERRPKRDDD